MRRAWMLVCVGACVGMACNDGDGPLGPPRGVGADAEEQCEVPTEPEALRAFLIAGEYKAFPHEPEVHASSGPHFGRVQTYLNEILAESSAAGNREHPVCSASIKELYRDKDEVTGWSVFVKNYPVSDGGRGFYWLETLSTAADHEPDYAGQGLGICVNCHDAGHDYLRTPYPFQ